MLASINNNREANFAHGFLLHEGRYVKKDIANAIHYYKEASSFNNQYSKNNLGVIYKHGYNEIEGKVGNAIVYFEEAIRQKNDYLSMYNLAHIYMYDMQDFNKSIDLLIRSMNKFEHSLFLLCLALLKQFDFNIKTIKQELKKREDITKSLKKEIHKIISMYKLNFDGEYESYRNKEYLYNIKLEPVELSEIENINKKFTQPKYPNAKDLSSEFYKGFGEDLQLCIKSGNGIINGNTFFIISKISSFGFPNEIDAQTITLMDIYFIWIVYSINNDRPQ